MLIGKVCDEQDMNIRYCNPCPALRRICPFARLHLIDHGAMVCVDPDHDMKER
jgi:hypothetical protein